MTQPKTTPNDLAPFGISRKHWCPAPSLPTLGNYYRSYAIADGCCTGVKPLYFRSFRLGSSPPTDQHGEWYFATTFHVPLVLDTQTVAADCVTGFPVSGATRNLTEFGWLNGLTTASLRVITFSESANDPRSQISTESAHNQDPIYPTIPGAFAANVRAGQQICTFIDGSTHAFTPRWVFPQRLYFAGPSGRYRAVYTLEPMDYGSGKYGGRHQVVGFPVESTSGPTPRGFGQLERLLAESVSFEPT